MINNKTLAAPLFFKLLKFINVFKKIDLFDIGSRDGTFAKDYEKNFKVYKVDADSKSKKIKKVAFFSKSTTKTLYIYKKNASLYQINNDLLLKKKKIKVTTINNYIHAVSKNNLFAIALDCEGANLYILKPLIKSELKKKLILIFSEVEKKEIFIKAPLFKEFCETMKNQNYKLLYSQAFHSKGQSNAIFCPKSLYIYFILFIFFYQIIFILKNNLKKNY